MEVGQGPNVGCSAKGKKKTGPKSQCFLVIEHFGKCEISSHIFGEYLLHQVPADYFIIVLRFCVTTSVLCELNKTAIIWLLRCQNHRQYHLPSQFMFETIIIQTRLTTYRSIDPCSIHWLSSRPLTHKHTII
jgi:hypothetical protein